MEKKELISRRELLCKCTKILLPTLAILAIENPVIATVKKNNHKIATEPVCIIVIQLVVQCVIVFAEEAVKVYVSMHAQMLVKVFAHLQQIKIQ